MATVVHEHIREGNGSSNTIIGLVLLVILAILFFMYGLPLISRSMSGPQVTVPGQIDVNVNTPKQ